MRRDYLDALAAYPFSISDGHDRGCENRDRLLVSAGNGHNLCLAYTQRTPRAQNSAARYQRVSFGWRHEVDLEFNGENSGICRHEAERGVAARAVGNRRDGTGVNKAVLLGDGWSYRQMNFDTSGLDGSERRAKSVHELLPVETIPDTLLEIGVDWSE